jgi:hypothetical protein
VFGFYAFSQAPFSSLAGPTTYSGTASDSITFTETATPGLVAGLNASDALVLVDAASVTLGIALDAADTLVLADIALTASLSLNRRLRLRLIWIAPQTRWSCLTPPHSLGLPRFLPLTRLL